MCNFPALLSNVVLGRNYRASVFEISNESEVRCDLNLLTLSFFSQFFCNRGIENGNHGDGVSKGAGSDGGGDHAGKLSQD